MKNDSQFVVRLSKEDLEKFNGILKKKAINRSELFRIWIRNFIEENEKKHWHCISYDIQYRCKVKENKKTKEEFKMKRTHVI